MQGQIGNFIRTKFFASVVVDRVLFTHGGIDLPYKVLF